MARRTQESRNTPVEVAIPKFGLFVLSSKHGASFRMPFETRNFHKLVLVSDGRGFLGLHRGPVKVAAGDLCWIPPDTRHRFGDDPENPMTLNVASITPRLIQSAPWLQTAWRDLTRRLPRNKPSRIVDPYRQSQLVRSYRALVFEQTQARPRWELALVGGLVDLLVESLRALEPRKRRGVRDGRSASFDGTLNWIDNHFHEPLRIADLAAQAEMSYRSYTAHFKRATGQTVNEYIARLRTRYAAQRIEQGAGIVEASLEAGFQDLSHFYRVFKRHHGVTPGKLV